MSARLFASPAVMSAAIAPPPSVPVEPARRPPPPSLMEETGDWLKERYAIVSAWARREPGAAASLGVLFLLIVVAFGFLRLFNNYQVSAFGWVWGAWNPETNYEHGPLIPLIALALFLHKLPELARLPAERPSRWGLAWIVAGTLLWLLAARTLQPRIALAALPCLLFGAVLHGWGARAGRLTFFPIMFLLFAVPLNFLQQATVNNLQRLSTWASTEACNFVGIKIAAVGTSMRAVDESFSFEIAEGCSGINSLMAITMLTAVFVHLTQDRLWKKFTLFALSGVFAVIGNVARITTIMIVAKFGGQKFAGGIFHDWSAYVISFPFAFLAMWGASKLVNLRPSAVRARLSEELKPVAVGESPVAAANKQFDY